MEDSDISEAMKRAFYPQSKLPSENVGSGNQMQFSEKIASIAAENDSDEHVSKKVKFPDLDPTSSSDNSSGSQSDVDYQTCHSGSSDFSSTDSSKNTFIDEDFFESLKVQTKPILIGMDKDSKKFIIQPFKKDSTLKARFFLKKFGLREFLSAFLPDELTSLHLYYLIKLLGYELRDEELLKMIYDSLQVGDHSEYPNIVYNNLDDPLEKTHVSKIFKDFQTVVTKVLNTHQRMPNYINIESFVNVLKKAQNVIVLTGAGISTSLGIPDFRSSDGFYSKIRHLGLEDPQDVFNYQIFMQNPSVFYNIAHLVLPPENIYSPLHSFLKMLQDKNKLLRNYTQNIDNLESYAGIEPEKMVQCHGSFATASCSSCGLKLPGEAIFSYIRKMEIPICPNCAEKRSALLSKQNKLKKKILEDDNSKNTESDDSSEDDDIYISKSFGVLKPDITFFGEALPDKFHDMIKKDLLECDLLICIGTSLKVAPVSDIIKLLPSHVPQILINKDIVKHASFDLSLLGYCDDVASYITKKCGWEIPHKKWDELQTKKFKETKIEEGVYNITDIEDIMKENEQTQESNRTTAPP